MSQRVQVVTASMPCHSSHEVGSLLTSGTQCSVQLRFQIARLLMLLCTDQLRSAGHAMSARNGVHILTTLLHDGPPPSRPLTPADEDAFTALPDEDLYLSVTRTPSRKSAITLSIHADVNGQVPATEHFGKLSGQHCKFARGAEHQCRLWRGEEDTRCKLDCGQAVRVRMKPGFHSRRPEPTLQEGDMPASAGLYQRDVGIGQAQRGWDHGHERIVARHQPQGRRPDVWYVLLRAAVCKSNDYEC